MSVGKIAIAGALLGGVYVSVPREPPDRGLVLAQPAEIAAARLREKSRVVEGTGMGSLTIAPAGASAGAILIGVTRAGDPRRVTCRVAIASASAETSRAEVDCAQAPSQHPPIRRVGVKALELVVREHVAASVAQRPYDIDAVSDRLIALLVVNRAAVAASLQPPGD
jgi:hypothetical protein